MVVKLDLRLPGKETREERESGLKHLLLFAAVFLFAIASTLVFMIGGWQLYSLRSQRLELNEGVLSNTEKIAIMDKELGRITGEMTKLESTLDYLLSDIPSVELLTSLARIIPADINVEFLSLTSSRLTLSGTGKNEEQILLFANDLNEAHFAKGVSVPVISPGTRNGVSVRTFKLECTLLPLDQIIAAGRLTEIKKTDSDKEEETL
ncbi:MAG TPA: hypothetical protein DCL58_06520 [Synergistaceae bacterium]|jgi:Tfp pilus assembly protein PilN|uniref:PilN domain-containing protein n=1 Tax=Synergistaceae TaxID=649777 RepID=UPI000EC567C8|nr:PilN domain-containing protein [Synergistaceae bacterium DZ-S4]HAH69418.1 hypothetical protein [Synergistaceae bacterium]